MSLAGDWGRDLAQAIRALARRPGLTGAAVLSLALGIGANTAIFAVLAALFLDPLPGVVEPDRLVRVYTRAPAIDAFLPVSHPNLEDLDDSFEAVPDLAALSPVTVALAGDVGDGEPELLGGELVSDGYFDLLGASAAVGDVFHEPPDGAARVVLSHGLWQRRFGSDPEIVGRAVRINDVPFTVVGVAEEGFGGARRLGEPQLWVPLDQHPSVLARQIRPFFDERRATLLGVVGRLAPGASLDEASAELDSLSEELARRHPEANGDNRFVVRSLASSAISPNSRDGYLRSNLLLLAMTGLVLLVAAANVANMLLVRALDRRREMAVRLALGASRAQLVRRFLTESLSLAAVAGLLGLGLGVVMADLLPRLGLPYLPSTLEPRLDPVLLAYALGVTAAIGLFFGLAPALQASRPELVPSLKAERGLGDRSSTGSLWQRVGLRGLLVTVQVALSLVAVVGAALFGSSLAAAQRIDPGFAVDELLVISFDLDGRSYDPVRGLAWMEQATERVEALPGVRGAAIGQGLALVDSGLRRGMTPAGGGEDDEVVVQTNAVAPGYFETLGIPLLAGRGPGPEDRPDGRPVLVVNRTLAETLWGDGKVGQALGQELRLAPDNVSHTVVGVVEDVDYNDLGEASQPYAYFPLSQAYAGSVTLHVRTEGDPASLAQTVRRTVQELDPALPLVGLEPMSAVLGGLLAAQRAVAWLLAAFGVLAVLLAVVGIYGVLAYTVAQRRREVGVRMALGAQRRQVVGLFVRRIAVTIAAGLVVGVAVAVYSSTLLEDLLYEAAAPRWGLYAAAALGVAAVALAVGWLSSRRAARVPPMVVLRDS